MATVLKRPAALGEVSGGPAQQTQMARGCSPDGPLGELAAKLIDDHDGVRALVQIGSDDHHVRCPSGSQSASLRQTPQTRLRALLMQWPRAFILLLPAARLRS